MLNQWVFSNKTFLVQIDVKNVYPVSGEDSNLLSRTHYTSDQYYKTIFALTELP